MGPCQWQHSIELEESWHWNRAGKEAAFIWSLWQLCWLLIGGSTRSIPTFFLSAKFIILDLRKASCIDFGGAWKCKLCSNGVLISCIEWTCKNFLEWANGHLRWEHCIYWGRLSDTYLKKLLSVCHLQGIALWSTFRSAQRINLSTKIFGIIRLLKIQ